MMNLEMWTDWKMEDLYEMLKNLVLGWMKKWCTFSSTSPVRTQIVQNTLFFLEKLCLFAIYLFNELIIVYYSCLHIEISQFLMNCKALIRQSCFIYLIFHFEVVFSIVDPVSCHSASTNMWPLFLIWILGHQMGFVLEKIIFIWENGKISVLKLILLFDMLLYVV